tara:strand:+ start:134 stop:586 length:453 start_codon:yes stop_codon:yes gene_type:complete
MSEEMNQGIRLAAMGMGLVFCALLAFMLILFALRQFFPGEELPSEDDEDNPDQLKYGNPDNLYMTNNGDNHMKPEHDRTNPTGSNKAVVALAISTYLSMEELDTYKSEDGNTHSGWSKQSRNNVIDNQGARPDSFNEKPYSRYFPKDKTR